MVIGYLYVFEIVPRSLAFVPGTLCAKTFFLRIGAAEQLIPKLDKKPTMIGSIHDRFVVMTIMLEGGVDHFVVSREKWQLVTRMKVNSVKVEKDAVHHEQHVNVDFHDQGKNQKRSRSEELKTRSGFG